MLFPERVTVRLWGPLQYVLLSLIYLGGLWLVLYVINKVGYVAHQFHFAVLLLSYKMVFHASIDSQIDSFPHTDTLQSN